MTWPHCHFCDKPYIPIPGVDGCPWCDTQAKLTALTMTLPIGKRPRRTQGHRKDGRPYCEAGCARVVERGHRGWRSLCSTCRKQRHAHNQENAA